MPHTYAQNTIHVVFSTKDRRKTISAEFQPKMWAYAAGICKNLGILVHAIGGMEDHVHFLIQVPPTMALAKAFSLSNPIPHDGRTRKVTTSHGERATRLSA